MNARWFDTVAVMRLDPGEEAMAVLRDFATREDILHTHAAVADVATRTHSGHLNIGIVRPTLEIFLTLLHGTLGRKKDPATGLELLELKAAPGRS